MDLVRGILVSPLVRSRARPTLKGNPDEKTHGSSAFLCVCIYRIARVWKKITLCGNRYTYA